jgi:hypothetical protein
LFHNTSLLSRMTSGETVEVLVARKPIFSQHDAAAFF